MADAYDIMMGDPLGPDEDMQATARSLRGQQNLGNLLSMTGYSRAQPMGKQMSGQALKKAAYIADLRQQEKERASDEKRWRAEMGLKQRKLDQDEAKGAKMPYQQQTDLADAATSADNLSMLSRTFSDDFTGFMPGAQGMSNWIASKGMGTEDAERGQQWWAEFDRMYTLPTRNKQFGATLTPGEKEAWAKANINENMGPDQIRANLAVMEGIARDSMSKLRQNAIDMGANPQQVFALTKKQKFTSGRGQGGDIQPGAVQDGHRYLGGNKADPNSWEEL